MMLVPEPDPANPENRGIKTSIKILLIVLSGSVGAIVGMVASGMYLWRAAVPQPLGQEAGSSGMGGDVEGQYSECSSSASWQLPMPSVTVLVLVINSMQPAAGRSVLTVNLITQ